MPCCIALPTSALAVVRILPYAADPGIRPRPDRVVGLAVPGTTRAADQMPCHLGHRHALGKPQYLGIEIEVPLWSAIAAMDLQQLALPDQVADRHRFEA